VLIIDAESASSQILESLFVSPVCSYKKILVSQLQEHDLENAIPIFVRTLSYKTLKWIRYLNESKIDFYYYLDDNFWEMKGEYAFNRRYNHPLVLRIVTNLAQSAKLTLVNSENLCEYIKINISPNVTCLPCFFDFSLLDDLKKESVDEFRVGFVGSPTRIKDINFFPKMIELVSSEAPDVVFEFAGVKPLGLKSSSRLRSFLIPKTYRHFIPFLYSRNWAVGLAPLSGSLSDRYKTNNKFREYASCGILGIYTKHEIYDDVLKNPELGYSCSSSDPLEWAERILYIYRNKKECDPMRQKAENYARSQYSLTAAQQSWFNIIFNKETLSQVNGQYNEVYKWTTIEKITYFFHRIKIFIISSYQLNGFKGLIKKIIFKAIISLRS